MNFYGMKVPQVVGLMVDHFGWRSVADEVMANKERHDRVEVDALNSALVRFGQAISMPYEEVAKSLVKTPAVGPKAGDYVEVTFKIKAPPKKAHADVGKVVAQVISAEGWDFVTQHYSRNLKNGHVVVNLVGQHFRTSKDQETLAGKKMHNMALLVAEPTNPADVNAVMVLMWDWEGKVWRHVGYVKAEQAAKLRSTWPEDDVRKVQVAAITDMPSGFDGHRTGRNLKLTVSGEYRTYPSFQKLV